jgi:PAS domain S-box-containing protein
MGIDQDMSLTDPVELRRHAEERLQANAGPLHPPRTKAETQWVVHELEVHQIELEMQNAELSHIRDEMETALDRYADLYDFAPVGYFTLDHEGAVTAANLTAARLVGVERSRLLGRRFGLFVTPEDRLLFAEFLGKVFASHCKESCEVQLTPEGAAPLFVQIEAVVLVAGQECRVAVIDMTAHRQAEEAARDNEQIYRAIGEAIDYGVWICAPDGRTTYASDSFLRLVGMTQEQCANFGWGDVLHPDDAEQTILAWQECVRTQGVWDIEHRFRGVDGQFHSVLARGVSIKNDRGEIVNWVGINLDISKMKLAEERLRQSEQLLAQAQRMAHVGNWQWDPIADNITGSEEFYRLVGLCPRTYDVFMERVHPDDRELVNQAVRETLDRHVPFDRYFRIKQPDGTGKIIHSQGEVVVDGAGVVTGMVGTAQDVTTSKRAEEELRTAHDELDMKVQERTEELTRANKHLTEEIDERKRAEESLQSAFAEIEQLKNRLQAENIYLRQEVARKHNFGEIIGQSSALSYVLFRVEQVAPQDATVLLLGETGTGKGVVAGAIHRRSARKDRPMITVNCTSLPANLIEAELFGRERGAFTGAHDRQIGRFELADGGTIFLDEIGDVPLELQSKLLRVIQNGEFERLGSSRTIKVNVRIIAATNRNLEEGIRGGTFREDLFYRLNVFPITMPPLRQRPEDIPLLVTHFVAKFNKKMGRKIETVAKDTMTALQEYHWPGNVRELESVIERAIITSPGIALQVLDRFDTFRKPEEPTGQEIKVLADLEQHHIIQVLQKTGWRVEGKNGAALLLGMHPSTLRARMRKFGIRRD